MARVRHRFSILWFTMQISGEFAVLMAGYRFFFAQSWERQFASGWPVVVLAFLAIHLVMCFFEWAFHRYVLHAVTSRWLTYFARGHRSHHGLTAIQLRPVSAGSDRYVLNRYPITEEEQYPDSSFPVYATAAFWVLFTPVLLALQWLLPHAPILLSGYSAITLSMYLYEVLHALEHQPYPWWKRAVESRQLGFLWRRVYGFHHMHHANVSCNEAISGFFGLPVADWVMRTYHQPRDLLLEGRMATARDFAVPPPPAAVRWLDAWARKRETSIRAQERERATG